MIINGFEVIPQNERKNILFLSDDLRLTSGVGVMSKKIVMGTAHRFNWFQLGAAINHPDKGKRIDVSADVNKYLGINDSKVLIQPNDGYGDPDLLRFLLKEFKFDAILHFTDPRQWIWLYNMEHEIRQDLPIFFYSIWDAPPAPMYNEPFYRSCDWIGCISKQTKNLIEIVLDEANYKSNQITYIPHGIDKNEFYPIDEQNQGKMVEIDINGNKEIKTEYEAMLNYKKDIFGDKEYDFVVLYNNRNIKRKMPGDVILAYKNFCDTLTEEQSKRCVLIMHTQPIDQNGTNLIEVGNRICPNYEIIYYDARIPSEVLNYLYNITDVTINLASAEGFGLSTAESLMSGTPILANVTGGLQDQMKFVDENGDRIKFDKNWLSNHDGKYKNHGDWVFAVYPAARGLVGSPPTPYIFDDRAKWEDAAIGLKYWYDLGREKRKELGLHGREFMCEQETGMEAGEMSRRFIVDMENAIKEYVPRERFELLAA